MNSSVPLPHFSEKLLLIFFIVLFIFIRSINFTNSLNFSKDPAIFSIKALEIYQDNNQTLIGPTASPEYHGRFIFQGPLIYYFQLGFLILGNFDPIKSSYFFMIFSSLMIVPLYYGVKKLINENSATLMMIIYTLFPFFVDYTKFMWNPNFQLALTPLLILLMGVFHKKRSQINFLILSTMMGALLQFHYLFLVVIIGITFYYFLFLKLDFKYFLVYILGFSLGMFPLILFELRNSFYNLRTLLLFIQHWKEVFYNPLDHGNMNHYKLSLTFFGILVGTYLVRKKTSFTLLTVVFVGLFVWSFLTYLPNPEKPYGISYKWKYTDELKTNQIIRDQKLTNFAVTNLIYDTEAMVQKYLLKKERVEFSNNYKTDDYLFIITDKADFLDDQAYEVKNILPAIVVDRWEITQRYSLYLAKRIPRS